MRHCRNCGEAREECMCEDDDLGDTTPGPGLRTIGQWRAANGPPPGRDGDRAADEAA